MRKTILYILTVFSGSYFAQQTPCTATSITPSADGNCTLSGALTAPATVNSWSSNGSGGVTSGLVNTCMGTSTTGAGNLWLTFTAPSSGLLAADIQVATGGGANINNPEYQIYQQTGGSCGASNMTLSYLGCSSSGVTGSISITPGATYYIRIYDDNADSDISGEKYKYCVGYRAINDNCAQASAVTPGTPIAGSTYASSLDAPFTGGGWCPTGNVWYTFTTPASPGCYSFYNTQSASGCNYVSVYQGGCPGTGTLLNNNVSTNIYNDQGSSEPGFGGMLPNTTYYVSVANDIPSGTFTLNVKPSTPAASNDLCSGAQSIGTTSVQTDNAVAGCEYSYVAAQDANIAPANICAGSLENVSWFTFTALTSGTVTITFSNILCNNGGGGFQTGLFTGTCATYTLGTSGTAICAAAASGTVTYNIPTAIAGQTYLIGMDGNAGSNCHFAVSGTNITLPIELIRFNASLNKNNVDLIWATASEKNNDFFTLERSIDGSNFESIGTVKGAGTSVIEKNYYFQDKSPILGTSYYRLKQTDFNRKESYSMIQSISLDKKYVFDFKLYPNPSDEDEDIRLQFYSKENDLVNVLITDLTGKVISEKSILLNADAVEINLKHHFGPGIYFIKASNNSGESINQKFIVK